MGGIEVRGRQQRLRADEAIGDDRVYEPNRAVNGNNFFNQLQSDLATKASKANGSAPVKFWAKYVIGAFHGAHSTGGLGRMALSVDVNVTARSRTDWELEGTAILRPEKWDFDWSGALSQRSSGREVCHSTRATSAEESEEPPLAPAFQANASTSQ
ncbi:MAG TPA: hypothetical protein VJV78_24195 [Polyangiales bacterium]|nr:hypothetical protein [Polyangiales bacterium]